MRVCIIITAHLMINSLKQHRMVHNFHQTNSIFSCGSLQVCVCICNKHMKKCIKLHPMSYTCYQLVNIFECNK